MTQSTCENIREIVANLLGPENINQKTTTVYNVVEIFTAGRPVQEDRMIRVLSRIPSRMKERKFICVHKDIMTVPNRN